MRDEDFEHEWQLQEIKSRKAMTVILSVLLCIITDIIWTWGILSKVNITGKIIKAVLNFFIFLSLYNLYFSPKVK
jgi:hypothetical protein